MTAFVGWFVLKRKIKNVYPTPSRIEKNCFLQSVGMTTPHILPYLMGYKVGFIIGLLFRCIKSSLFYRCYHCKLLQIIVSIMVSILDRISLNFSQLKSSENQK